MDRGDGSGLNQVRHSIGKEKRKMMVKREIDGMSEQNGSVAASLPLPTTLSLSFKPPEKKTNPVLLRRRAGHGLDAGGRLPGEEAEEKWG